MSLGAPALAPDHPVKVRAWREQAGALAAQAWRLTLKSRRPELRTYNHGKGRGEGGAERFYSAAEVEQLIPQLRRENARGFDVYVTPIDRAHHYLVIDDMRDAGAALRVAGWAPALVQSSSPDNWQAIVKAPRIERPDEQTIANELVQQLNQAHGDPKFSGVVHPFRMAGFANKKPGKADSFTRIIEAAGQACRRAARWLQERRAEIDAAAELRARERAERERELDAAIAKDRGESRGPAFPRDEVYAEQYAEVERAVIGRGWPVDPSRIDFAVSRRMARAGWPAERIQAAILKGSPDLAQRHHDPADYAERTARNACAQVAMEPAKPKSATTGRRSTAPQPGRGARSGDDDV